MKDWLWRILLCLSLLISGFTLGQIVQESKLAKQTYVSKEKVIECFKNVNWRQQVFSVNDTILKSASGKDLFYEADSIDDAIKKLNEVLK